MKTGLTQAQIVQAIRAAIGSDAPALEVTAPGDVQFLLRGARYRILAGARIDVETKDGRKLGGDFAGCDRLQEKLASVIRKTAERLAKEAA